MNKKLILCTIIGILINPAVSMNTINNSEQNINDQFSFTNNTFGDTNNNNIINNSIINNNIIDNNKTKGQKKKIKQIKEYIKILLGNQDSVYDNMMVNKNFTFKQFKKYLNAIYEYNEKYKECGDDPINNDFCLFDLTKIKDWGKFCKWFKEIDEEVLKKIDFHPDKYVFATYLKDMDGDCIYIQLDKEDSLDYLRNDLRKEIDEILEEHAKHANKILQKASVKKSENTEKSIYDIMVGNKNFTIKKLFEYLNVTYEYYKNENENKNKKGFYLFDIRDMKGNKNYVNNLLGWLKTVLNYLSKISKDSDLKYVFENEWKMWCGYIDDNDKPSERSITSTKFLAEIIKQIKSFKENKEEQIQKEKEKNEQKVKNYIQKLQKKDVYSSIVDKKLTIEQFKKYLNAIYDYYKDKDKKNKKGFCLFDINKIINENVDNDFKKFWDWFKEIENYFRNNIANRSDFKDIANKKFKMYYKNDKNKEIFINLENFLIKKDGLDSARKYVDEVGNKKLYGKTKSKEIETGVYKTFEENLKIMNTCVLPIQSLRIMLRSVYEYKINHNYNEKGEFCLFKMNEIENWSDFNKKFNDIDKIINEINEEFIIYYENKDNKRVFIKSGNDLNFVKNEIQKTEKEKLKADFETFKKESDNFDLLKLKVGVRKDIFSVLHEEQEKKYRNKKRSYEIIVDNFDIYIDNNGNLQCNLKFKMSVNKKEVSSIYDIYKKVKNEEGKEKASRILIQIFCDMCKYVNAFTSEVKTCFIDYSQIDIDKNKINFNIQLSNSTETFKDMTNLLILYTDDDEENMKKEDKVAMNKMFKNFVNFMQNDKHCCNKIIEDFFLNQADCIIKQSAELFLEIGNIKNMSKDIEIIK